MLTLRGIVVFVLSLSFLVFVALFGRLPASRGTPISFLYRTLWIRIPRAFRQVDSILTGGRGSRAAGGFWEYLLYKNHPVVMILYLIILTGSAILFIPATYPTLSSGQLSLLLFLLTLPYFFTYLCASSTASTIAPNSDTTAHESCSLYPYDHIIFHPRNICRTCKIPKPARSKHCSFCDCCVIRMDHHCHWITNCVGRANYVSFMFLLLSLHALLVYAAYLAYAEISRRLALVDKYNTYKDDLAVSFSSSLIDTARAYFTSRIYLFNRCLQLGGLRIGGVGLLCTLTSPLPAFMFGYHIYLLWAGMTTNESDKWANLREDMRDGLVYRGLIKNHGDDDDNFYQCNNMNSNHCYNNNGREGGEEDKEPIWPNRSRYMVLVLDNDNSFNNSSSDNNNNEVPTYLTTQSPSELPAHITDKLSNTVDPASWERVWHLNEVENIYDVGFWTALADVWSGWDCRL